MFYSTLVSTKKSPLSRIWQVAHSDKKLSKPVILETDIEKTVESIVHPQVPLALRVSSMLLFGVSRIYVRKVKLLHTEAYDAMTRINSFRGGDVDLPSDAPAAGGNLLTHAAAAAAAGAGGGGIAGAGGGGLDSSFGGEFGNFEDPTFGAFDDDEAWTEVGSRLSSRSRGRPTIGPEVAEDELRFATPELGRLDTPEVGRASDGTPAGRGRASLAISTPMNSARLSLLNDAATGALGRASLRGRDSLGGAFDDNESVAGDDLDRGLGGRSSLDTRGAAAAAAAAADDGDGLADLGFGDMDGLGAGFGGDLGASMGRGGRDSHDHDPEMQFDTGGFGGGGGDFGAGFDDMADLALVPEDGDNASRRSAVGLGVSGVSVASVRSGRVVTAADLASQSSTESDASSALHAHASTATATPAAAAASAAAAAAAARRESRKRLRMDEATELSAVAIKEGLEDATPTMLPTVLGLHRLRLLRRMAGTDRGFGGAALRDLGRLEAVVRAAATRDVVAPELRRVAWTHATATSATDLPLPIFPADVRRQLELGTERAAPSSFAVSAASLDAGRGALAGATTTTTAAAAAVANAESDGAIDAFDDGGFGGGGGGGFDEGFELEQEVDAAESAREAALAREAGSGDESPAKRGRGNDDESDDARSVVSSVLGASASVVDGSVVGDAGTSTPARPLTYLESMLAGGGTGSGATASSSTGSSSAGAVLASASSSGDGSSSASAAEDEEEEEAYAVDVSGDVVPVRKWHTRTRRTLVALDHVLRAQGSEVEGSSSVARKRSGAAEAAAGSTVTFQKFVEGSSRGAVASAFLELLVLRSWDLVDVQQAGAEDPIVIRKTVRFDDSVKEAARTLA